MARPLLLIGLAVAMIFAVTWLPTIGRQDSETARDHQVVIWGWNIAAMSLESLTEPYRQIEPDTEVIVRRDGANVQSRLLLSLAGGVGSPDVCQLQEREAGKFTATGRLFDLTSYARAYENDFVPAFWESGQFEGKTLAIPWDIGPCAVYYKRWIFDRYGIDPESIETWDDFIAAGLRIKNASGGRTLMMPLSANGLPELYQILMQQAGGGVFDRDGRIVLESPQNVQALEVLRAILDSGITAPLEGPERLASFGTDSVACYARPAWFMQQIKDYAAGTDGQWGVFRLPAFSAGGLRTSNLGGSVLIVPEQSESAVRAWEFIEFTNCNVESQVQQYRDFGLFPAYLPALEDPFFDEPDDFFGGQSVHRLFTLDLERLSTMHRTRDWSEAERYFRQTLSTWAADRIDHRAYLAKAAEALSRKLAREIKVANQSESSGGN